MVFSATEHGSGMSAAIKKSRISLRVQRTMLRHEARVMQLLQGHPAIPRFFGYLRVPHFEYIAIELLGQDMKGSYKPGHALNIGTVACIAEQMVSCVIFLRFRSLIILQLSALEHLNAHGIVHRDIKPENILSRPSDPSCVTLIDFGLARKLTAADTLPKHRYNPIESNRNVVGTLHWCSINSHLGYGLCYANLFILKEKFTDILDLRPYDDLESLAYTLLFLLIGDLPWRISAPRESTKNAMIRILAAKQAFTGSSIPSIIPVEFRELLDFSRNAKGDITGDLAEMRIKMHTLASNLDESENKSLDFTHQDALFPPENQETNGGSESDSDEECYEEPNEEYSNSYWGLDIDCWDMRDARDKSLTFPADEAEWLDGLTPEIAVIDE